MCVDNQGGAPNYAPNSFGCEQRWMCGSQGLCTTLAGMSTCPFICPGWSARRCMLAFSLHNSDVSHPGAVHGGGGLEEGG